MTGPYADWHTMLPSMGSDPVQRTAGHLLYQKRLLVYFLSSRSDKPTNSSLIMPASNSLARSLTSFSWNGTRVGSTVPVEQTHSDRSRTRSKELTRVPFHHFMKVAHFLKCARPDICIFSHTSSQNRMVEHDIAFQCGLYRSNAVLPATRSGADHVHTELVMPRLIRLSN